MRARSARMAYFGGLEITPVARRERDDDDE
jgi:hypothetical protein